MIEIMKRILSEVSNCMDIVGHQGTMLSEMLKLAPLGVHAGFRTLPDKY